MPDRNRVLKALQKLELLIVQDIFLTETVRLATVVLPAATAAEKSGSFTSVDNRVQCFNRAVAPIGLALADAEVLTKLYNLVAPVSAISGQSAEELHREITTLTGLYNETCDHEGCRMGRVKNRVAFSDRPAKFVAVTPTAVAAYDQAYPFCLTLGSILHHNGSMTLWSDNNMNVAGQAYVSVNPADAARIGLAAGATAKVTSEVGSVALSIQLSENVQTGALFVPSHFRESLAGILLKGSANTAAVKLEKS